MDNDDDAFAFPADTTTRELPPLKGGRARKRRTFSLGKSVGAVGTTTQEAEEPIIEAALEKPIVGPALAGSQSPGDYAPIGITLGKRRNGRSPTGQSSGNYRMLIDDLSYLCSAIIQCRAKRGVQCEDRGMNAPVMIKHTNVTSGAACDLAELVSQNDTRCALLTVGGEEQSVKNSNNIGGGKIVENSRVGALEAVLESISCAPNISDNSVVCCQLVEGKYCLCRDLTHTQDIMARKTKRSISLGNTKLRLKNDEGSNDDLSSSSLLRGQFEFDDISSSNGDLGSSSMSREQFDDISTKALSIVAYFIGVACAGSDGAAFRSRKCVLRHKPALQGIARLVADDPVVHSYLYNVDKLGMLDCNGSTQTIDSRSSLADSEGVPSSQDTDFTNTSFDPTKAGRQRKKNFDPTKAGRRRKKRKTPHNQTYQESPSVFTHATPSGLTALPEDGGEKGASGSLDFSAVETGTARSDDHKQQHVGGKCQSKIPMALTRMKLTSANVSGILLSQHEGLDCKVCSAEVPGMMSNFDQNKGLSYTISASSLALLAIDCIITGKDKSSEEENADDIEDDDDNMLGNDPMSDNPIEHANEMLRQSGSLPYYSKSMSETMVAILISCKETEPKSTTHVVTCRRCIAYLHFRASLLSDVIDNLCCLSPMASAALSHKNYFLIPSLLRAIAELSFVVEGKEVHLGRETISTALKTLTSLTHENPVACNQLISSFRWEMQLPGISRDSESSQITGLDIIFSYLLKAVLSKQAGQSDHKSSFDEIVYCLNILTNIVEVIPTPSKSMIQAIILNGDDVCCAEPNTNLSGLTWLTRWIVSLTSGFKNSVLNGNFGIDEPGPDDNDEDFETREQGNLVTAGNGFVLLACLLIHDDNTLPHNLRSSILAELPSENENTGGIQFMINTLKAFCNLYHCSVGDLSVAVIAPVVKLITGLEQIDICDHNKFVE